MNMQKNHLARKTTALLSAIAASSFLGLPALAGSSVGMTNTGIDLAQTPSNIDQSQCIPSNQANQPSTTATPDASAPAAAQLPNQSDPRTGISSSDQTVSSSSQTSGNAANTPSTNASAVQAADSANTNRQTSSYNQGSAYGDVLSQGGATTGGFARQQVLAANNPDDYRMVSSRISSNEERSNYRSGASLNGNMGSTMSSNDSTRSTTGNQPYNQSSSSAASTTIALCPNGVTSPQSVTPSTRQAPSQPNLDTQPSSSQQVSPQQPTGNETRQSPADDNSGRTR
ncbi:MAG: hypothetical protein KME45_15655 [Stenomitos rutilans HA7619-LM2]|jgi:cytoskeletal protein RodZ|nr:hypothetical protein [Stenomitos rutilans HA7619-LM2]